MYYLLTIFLKTLSLSALSLGYYWSFLRNKRLHSFNRFYLLFAVVISIALPFFHFEWNYNSNNTAQPQLFKLLEFSASNFSENEVVYKTVKEFSFTQIGSGIYIAISGFLLALMIIKIRFVYRLKKQSECKKFQNYYLIYTDSEKAPFSFFNLLFWKKSIDINSDYGQQILKHELTHIHQKHSIDKIWMQVITAFYWVNPLFWIIQKELSQIHEFIADEAAIHDNDTESFAIMLLQTHYGNSFRDVIHPFFHSSIKRRIIMLQQFKKFQYAKLRQFMIVPLLVAGAVLVSFEAKDTSVIKAKQPIILALDAGHGGNDNGAVGVNNLLEKDLNLMVVNKLTALAPEYNIQIVKTRKDDYFLTLKERPEIANNSSADILLSVHINSSTEKKDLVMPYELIVNERNNHLNESKTLASAIASRFSSSNIQSLLTERHLLVLEHAQMPAILIELGNIKNENQAGIIKNEKALEAICRDILSGIVDYRNRD